MISEISEISDDFQQQDDAEKHARDGGGGGGGGGGGVAGKDVLGAAWLLTPRLGEESKRTPSGRRA